MVGVGVLSSLGKPTSNPSSSESKSDSKSSGGGWGGWGGGDLSFLKLILSRCIPILRVGLILPSDLTVSSLSPLLVMAGGSIPESKSCWFTSRSLLVDDASMLLELSTVGEVLLLSDVK